RIRVADLTDRCSTVSRNAADFTAGQRDLRPARLASHQRRRRTSRATEPSASPRLHLDAVNVDAQRNSIQRQAVADVRRRVGAVFDRLADLQPIGSQDVSLLAIDKVKQRDAGIAAGIVLDRGDLRLHAVLVADEVDQAILLLVAATAMPGGDAALIVASAFLAERLEQRFFRPSALGQLGKIAHARPATAGGHRIVLSYSHKTKFQ